MHLPQVHQGQTDSPPPSWYITWYNYLIHSIIFNFLSLGKETQKISSFPYKVTQPVTHLVKQVTQFGQLVISRARTNTN